MADFHLLAERLVTKVVGKWHGTTSLDEEVHRQIRDLCAKGDTLVDEQRFEEAFGCYASALKLVPEPTEDWEATTWILAAIGDLYFLADKPDKALTAFDDAIRCPGGLGNPFIHMRIGQCCYDLGNQNRAADELTRAYMGGGPEILKARTLSISIS